MKIKIYILKNQTWIFFIFLINVIINLSCNSGDEQDGSKINKDLFEQNSKHDTSLLSKLSIIYKKFEDTSTKAEALIELDSLLNDTIQLKRILNDLEKSNPNILQEMLDNTFKNKLFGVYDKLVKAYELAGTDGVIRVYDAITPSGYRNPKMRVMIEKWKPQKRPSINKKIRVE